MTCSVFIGLALAFPSRELDFFEYFLDPRHHKPGIPLDMISYHFYASPAPDETPDIQQHTFFAQADGFLNVVRYIERIRERLSPKTATAIDEIGAISADDGAQGGCGHTLCSGLKIADLQHAVLGVEHLIVPEEVDRDRRVVLGDAGLLGDVERLLLEAVAVGDALDEEAERDAPALPQG